MACAVHTTLRAGQGYTSVEMKLNFVRPVLPGLGEVACEGTWSIGAARSPPPRASSSTAGRLLAHGSETCMIFDAAPAPRRPPGGQRRDVISAAPTIRAPPTRVASVGTSSNTA